MKVNTLLLIEGIEKGDRLLQSRLSSLINGQKSNLFAKLIVMEKIIRWFIENKVVSNLLMVLILVTGATTIPPSKWKCFLKLN